MTHKRSGRAEWSKGALYLFLMRYLPQHRTTFDILDFPRLSSDLGYSNETVYQWVRSSKLKPKHVTGLLDLIRTPGNLAALAAGDVTPPEIRDFDQFVY